MYKKLSLFLTLILVAIIACACGIPHADAGQDEPFTNKNIHITIDNETGCEYIVYSRSNMQGAISDTITPRLNHAGVPMCKAENTAN